MWPSTNWKKEMELTRPRYLSVVSLVLLASACGSDSGDGSDSGGSDDVGGDALADTSVPDDDTSDTSSPDADTDVSVDSDTVEADGADDADAVEDAESPDADDAVAADTVDAEADSDARNGDDTVTADADDVLTDDTDIDGPDVPEVPTDWDVCPRIIGTRLATCIEEQLLDVELAYSRGGRQEAHYRCTDAEPAAVAWDAWCASPDAEAFACGSTFETWYETIFPACRKELSDWNYDRTCVFGPRWATQDLEPSIREISRQWFVDASEFDSTDAEQLIRAVQLAGSPEVSTLSEALSNIDAGEARRIALWDTSSRQTWVLWEFGRGDNSYGAWFAADQATAVARVADGDTYDCEAFYGDEMRACTSSDDCAEGLRCVGFTDVFAGRCVNLTLDPPDLATPCDAEEAASCGEDSALLCSGATNDFAGQCRPAWMRGNWGVSPEMMADDADPQGLRSQIVATGIATVTTDVSVRIVLQHPDMSQVSLTLENPAGTVANIPIPDGADSYLIIDQFVPGFPGDESANGIWTLTVLDSVADGQAAYLQEWTLRLGSRWD